MAPDRSASRRQANAINTGAESLVKGSKVWIKAGGKSEWEQGELKSMDGSEAQVLLDNTGKMQLVKVDPDNPVLVPANPKVQDNIPDLTHLSYLNEPAILYDLFSRYLQDDIYTFAGSVLIAVNPCKPLELYTQETANAYKAGARDVVHSAHMAPHIYLVAANAFRQMIRERSSQSLIVNGESGAGKTETTKKAMQYFATLAGGTGVEDQVLETNPILEAFGNAKTLRNHNSSRFGKLIQIHFNQAYHICGATIKTYLLEKSRVVHQLKGERSYHIFYQLVKGADPALRQELRLPAHPTGFKYLANSGCTDIEGVDDVKEYKSVCLALTDIGIDAAQQHALFKLLAGILWLGNLSFVEDTSDPGSDASKVVEDEACAHVCFLLGVTSEALNQALTLKRLVAVGEVVMKELKVSEANDCRDALAKALYASAFNWIVSRINQKLDAGKVRQGSGLSIAILDIYGFEQFQTNSFEQLCINYANERLQQQFTRHQFSMQQMEYVSEGIDWTKVEFIDNYECVDAIEAAPPKGLGVLATLDSQCKWPQSTDQSFVRAIKEALGNHTHCETNPRNPYEFSILHYAGSVCYNSEGFLEKNRDTLNADLIELMLGASSTGYPLVPELGQAIKEEVGAQTKNAQTVGGRFSMQLRELIAELDATGLHFVRCIKPNVQLAPAMWDEQMVLQQLRCCGVLEVARIARAGYPTRYTHQDFAQRYAILLPADQQAALLQAASQVRSSGEGSGALRACKQLLTIFGLHKEQYQIGLTKIFFRPGALGFVEDKWAAMQSGAVKIQAAYRMHKAHKAYHQTRASAQLLQALWRARGDRMTYQELYRQNCAAKTIQRSWRCYHTRSKFLQVVRAVIKLQMAWRRAQFQRRVNTRVRERQEEEAQKKMVQSRFETVQQEYGCDMDDVRAALAAWAAAKASAASGGPADLSQVMAQAQASRAVTVPQTVVIQPATAPSAPSQSTSAGGDAGLVAAGVATAAAAGAAVAAVSLGGAGPSGGGAATDGINPTTTSGRVPAGPGAPKHAPKEPGLDPTLLSSPSFGSGAAAAIQAARFAAQQAAKEEVEKLQVENMRLSKKLQLESSLKDRYQHKYNEQNTLWEQKMELLKEYIQTVRSIVGDAKLPPLPSALATATGINFMPTKSTNTPPMSPDTQAPDSDAAAFFKTRSPRDTRDTRDTVSSGGPVTSPAAAAPDHPVLPLVKTAASGATSSSPIITPRAPSASASGADSPYAHREHMQSPATGLRSFANPQSDEYVPPGNRAFRHSNDDAVNPPLRSFGPPRILPYEGDGTPGRSNGAAHSAARPPARRPPAPLELPQGELYNTMDRYHEDVARYSRTVAAPSPAADPHIVMQRVQRNAGPHPMEPEPLPPHTTTNPADNVTNKYVGQLHEQFGKVQKVLVDDLQFIEEVAQGRVAPVMSMDPAKELNMLRKKFELWKKEYKDKLATAEEVLKESKKKGRLFRK